MVFAAEPQQHPVTPHSPWKVLIVDDEQVVHTITTLVLQDFRFDNRPLEFTSAYSAAEAKSILTSNPKTFALVLLDVVMETDSSGLDLVRWIRDQLQDDEIRIVLRTGQPGAAPEKQVISDYDINDYKAKTELTDIKLYTTVTVALRGYRDLTQIRQTEQGLRHIVNSAESLFTLTDGEAFMDRVIRELPLLLSQEHHPQASIDSLVINADHTPFTVVAGSGSFAQSPGASVDQIDDPELSEILRSGSFPLQPSGSGAESVNGQSHPNLLVHPISDVGNNRLVLVMRAGQPLSPVERELVQIFLGNVSLALENLRLTEELQTTQHEIIMTLGEVVESRSQETGHHVKRVAELAALLAEELDLPQRTVEILRRASPMHDVGKIAIPDSILNKPGPLTEQEMDVVRRHTAIGYEILRSGTQPVLKAAAEIALTHHERWDGAGYPNRTRGQDIPLLGRITGLADVVDALSHDRAYKKGWPFEKVVEYVSAESARHFDPQLVEIFLRHVDRIDTILNNFSTG